MRLFLRIFLVATILSALCGSLAAQSSPPMYLFIPNGANSGNGEGIFSVFQVNPTTGALSVVPGSPFQAGSDAKALAVDPAGRFVYVLDDVTKNIWGYSIDPTTGVPTLLPGAPFASGLTVVSSIIVDPTARFLYVGGSLFNPVKNASTNSFAVFNLDPSTGIPTAISASPVVITGLSGSADVLDLVFDVSGTFLYADVTSYSIDFESGVPSLVGVNGDDLSNGSLALDPLGQYALLGTTFNLVDPIYGYISPIPEGKVTGNGGYVAFDPTGKYVYAYNCTQPCSSGTETTYQLNQAGPSLAQINTTAITGGSGPLVDPTGNFMYFFQGTTNSPPSRVDLRLFHRPLNRFADRNLGHSVNDLLRKPCRIARGHRALADRGH